jgi:uncharacterized peroxidase-related enzyme
MDQRAKPAPRLAPLPPDPELKEAFEVTRKRLGFVPNSMLIMQRKPAMVRAWTALTNALNDPETSKVDFGLKRLIGHMASRAAGCQYCMAHTAGIARANSEIEKKVAAIWDYETSPLFSEAERAALDFARAAASVPNAVTDEMFATMRNYWTEEQMVEIVGVIAAFGFLNRWNDTMATPLEDEPLEIGEKYLARGGWSAGKHERIKHERLESGGG